MYWLFCLSGALYCSCLSLPVSASSCPAAEYTEYMLSEWLLLLVLLYLACLAGAACTCLSGSTNPPRARKSLRPVCQE